MFLIIDFSMVFLDMDIAISRKSLYAVLKIAVRNSEKW